MNHGDRIKLSASKLKNCPKKSAVIQTSKLKIHNADLDPYQADYKNIELYIDLLTFNRQPRTGNSEIFFCEFIF